MMESNIIPPWLCLRVLILDFHTSFQGILNLGLYSGVFDGV